MYIPVLVYVFISSYIACGTPTKARIGNCLSSNFRVEKVLKQEDALSPLLFDFPLEYVITKVQETKLDWI